MTLSRMRAGLLVAVGLLVPALTTAQAWGSDHADTAENVNRSGADLNDLYIFPSPENANNVVLAMDVWGLIPAGQTRSFDPLVLYQFKIDTTGDAVEDLVIQAKFEGTGPSQRVRIAGPIRPARRGTQSVFMTPQPVVGRVNVPFFPTPGVRVFAGLREDPFFLDLEQFYAILPDRMTPLRLRQIDLPNPNAPQQPGWRPPGAAQDFFNNINTLAIVVELPKARLGGGVIRVWMTTSVLEGANNYRQQARQARPLTSEVLGTVTNRDHEKKNKQNPTEDRGGTLEREVEDFLTFPAERSRAIKDVIRSVLIPDVMIADLSQSGPAAFLGVETNGATGGRFGGRKLIDDVVDIDLMVVFGTVISDLGLAPADGQQKPSFSSDNVGPQSNITGPLPFPYLPPPA
ncbi:MAG: DUF4331 family protein [Singulisphaera sp.]